MRDMHYVCLEGLDKAIDKMSELGEVCPDTYGRVIGWAERHTVDAVEVVRCKDCKWGREHYDTDGNVPYWVCVNWDGGTDADGYCHEGERREDGRRSL